MKQANTETGSTSKGGVQSIEVGMQILKVLTAAGGSISLNELSQRANIHPSKVHRYLVSLVHSGLVAKTAHGQYDLGPYVLELGTSYLSRLDPGRIANDEMEKLRAKTDEGIILNVWGSAGSTVIRWFQSRHPISVGIRPGATFMTTMSASGHLFLAHLPESETRAIVERELQQLRQQKHPQAPKTMQDIESIKLQARQRGLSRVCGHSVEGISALSAPIFDYKGDITLTLALFGFTSTFDDEWDGRNARMLRHAAAQISHQLGYLPEQ
jgi:DNA-binding IclR family transcriptional regulator